MAAPDPIKTSSPALQAAGPQNVLLVPMQLTALWRQPGQPDLLGTATRFSALPFPLAPGSANPGNPYLSGIDGCMAPPFSPPGFKLPPGLHLHWALPKALTVGHAHGNGKALAFPAVPNRWLVTRRRQDAVEGQWVVESDYLHPVKPAMESIEPVLYEDQPGCPRAVAYPVRHRQGHVSYRYMGRCLTLAEWKQRGVRRDDYLPQLAGHPLTAIGYGEPLFAALYPNCHSVFGFHDPGSLAPQQETVYDVLGWYSDAAGEVLNSFLAFPDPYASLLSEYDWKVESQCTSDQGQWRLAPRDATQPFPRLTVCYARLRLAQPGLPANPESRAPLQLAVGSSGTEALSAYLAAELAAAHGGAKAILEEQLEALRLSAHLEGHHVDLGARFQDARHRKGFKAAPGGILWSVKKLGDPGDPDASLPPELAAALLDLNRAQRAYDQAQQAIGSLRRQLFADWYQYMQARYPASASGPSSDEIRVFARRESLEPLRQRLAATGTVVRQGPGGFVARDGNGKTAATLDARGNLKSSAPASALLAVQVLKGLSGVLTVLAKSGAWELTRQPAHRYWQPNEPVVLLAGDAVRSTPDLGGGDGLPCTLLTLPDAGPVGQQLDTLLAAVAALPATDPGFQTQDRQPWQPIGLEWEVEVYPVKPPGDAAADGFDYPADYLTASHDLPARGVDLALKPAALPSQAGLLDVYRGRTVLTHHAGLQQASNLAEYLEGLTLLDIWAAAGPLQADYDRQLLAWYRGKHASPGAPAADDPKLESTLPSWVALQYPFRQDDRRELLPPRDALSWYEGKPAVANGALTTVGQLPPAEQAQDPVVTALRAQVRLDGLHVLSQALGGFNAALLMHRQVHQLPITDPLCLESAEPRDFTFTAEVRRAVGNENRTAPEADSVFLPIRAGLLRLTGLRLVDRFGQVHACGDLTQKPVVRSEPLTPPAGAPNNDILLPPRLAQAAQVRFEWLAAGPADTPLCGWLVPNNLDSSLMVYDNTGTLLGSVVTVNGQTTAWEPAAGTDLRLSVLQIPNPSLRQLARHLCGVRDSFFQDFLTALDQALENIDPQSFAQHEALALLMGRPIAVVRARVGFELQGLPAVSASWQALAQGIQQSAPRRPTHGFEGVDLPIRIGEYELLDDGLVGYWIEDEDGAYRDDVFHAPQSGMTRGAAGSGPSIQTRTCVHRRLADPPLTLTVLMDPRGKLHATSGLLPTEVLEIPQELSARALGKIAVTFLTSPVLTDAAAIRLPLPAEPGYAWSFVDLPDAAGWQETATIAKTSPHATFGPPPRIVEGWLKLKPQVQDSTEK